MKAYIVVKSEYYGEKYTILSSFLNKKKADNMVASFNRLTLIDKSTFYFVEETEIKDFYETRAVK